MTVTVARILDLRYQSKKDGKFRLAIRVTFNRMSRQYNLDLSVTKEEFQKLSRPRLSQGLEEVRAKFFAAEVRARDIIRNMGTFTFDAFRLIFFEEKLEARRRKHSGRKSEKKTPNKTALELGQSPGRNLKYGQRKFDRIRSNVNYAILGPVAVAFGEYIKELELQGRIGTSESYFMALNSLLLFRTNLRFEEVTKDFLYTYEKWMLDRDVSLTTIGIYVRNLRAIMNIEISEGRQPKERYPFGRRKYVIPTSSNVKKALELSDVKKIYDYVPRSGNKNESFARDIWMFGYYANGINPKDIACLKWKNFDDEFIVLVREKTKFSTRTKPKNIVIPVNDDMKAVIDRWGNADRDAENYMFPILQAGLTPHRTYELVQGFTGIVNDWMRVIADNLGIKKRVSTLAWRHTFATVMKRAGASTEYIQEAFGHTNVKTTENYLDSFEFEIKKEYSKCLISFKNVPDKP